MKINFEPEYFKYAGKYRRFVMAALLIAVCAVSYLFIGKYWQLGIVAGPILSMGIICFMDFYIFGGTGIRRTGTAGSVSKASEDSATESGVSGSVINDSTADLADSPESVQQPVTATGEATPENDSADGATLLKALKQDLINKSVFSLLVMGFILAIVLFSSKMKFSRLFVLMCAAAVFSASQVITRLTLIIGRKLGTTFQRHSIIVYSAFLICALILLPMLFLINTQSKLLALVFAVVLEALSVLSALLLISIAKKSITPAGSEETTATETAEETKTEGTKEAETVTETAETTITE